ncbi:MAG TPA: PVC-type heme-binding CxxCH protein [Tepidisphaeraceae bacterium]|nr:PVC-type heme-binding CxxCH protein [Tepidisphaeraceae bacterium]
MIRVIGLVLLASSGVLVAIGSSPETTAATTSPASQPAPTPVPFLTPQEQATTFNLPPGFRAEVVASEPMVEHPVHVAFDPDGRMWVAEMRAYMPDTEGWGETRPIGRVSVLQDVDGDGRMDQSTVFADDLVLPRAVGFAGDGVLIASPPHLFFCRDTDGDGKADARQMLLDDAGTVGNPENSFNGLLYGLDNWIYNANYERRIRYSGEGKFTYSPVPDLGQFGIGRDDYGRLFFNTNSDHLRGSLVPPHYMTRNPHSTGTLANTRIATDQAVFPVHAATINRGYRPEFIHPDGRLKAFTAACSPWIYRGDLFPDEFYGNAFVAEATSNLVRRAVITEKDAGLSARNAYADREFIASDYERFRPVNFATGPEGALYVIDMHHGLIQHKISITEYARENYKAKNLHKHLRTGRIFRIVPDDKPVPVVRPNLSEATSEQLVAHLKHPNGWWRDTAQRLLVERQDRSVVPALQEMAAKADLPVHRLHALWTLEGIQLRPENVRTALADADEKVRANAIRLAELFLDPVLDQPLLSDVLKLKHDTSADVRLQFVLTMSGMEQDSAVAEVLRDHGGNYMLREAAISGLAKREIDFLERLLTDSAGQTQSEARHDVFTDVARAVTRRYSADEMLRLVELIGSQPLERQWQQLAMLEALPAVRKDDLGSEKPIDVPAKPAAIDALAASQHKQLASGAKKIAALFHWPGKPVPPRPKPAPLTLRQQELFELGREQYALVCAQCHQPDGMGAEGKAPRLRNSPWVLGPDKRLIRIVLHGMRGPVKVGDTIWNLDMPSWAAMTDEQIAGVLTYIRREWGHEAPAVSEADVHSIRDWNQARKDGWTEAELLQIR